MTHYRATTGIGGRAELKKPPQEWTLIELQNLDLNGDGQLNQTDVDLFIDLFNQDQLTAPEHDLDGDGDADIEDVLEFIAASNDGNLEEMNQRYQELQSSNGGSNGGTNGGNGTEPGFFDNPMFQIGAFAVGGFLLGKALKRE